MMKHISFASPYLQLIEDFNLPETIDHIAKFKPFRENLSRQQIIDIIQLKVNDKPVKQFSSGMRQRLKLGLALLANTNVVLLDEPVSNLDKEAIGWYQQMIEKYSAGRTILVCSNAIPDEYFFCNSEIRVTDYKQ